MLAVDRAPCSVFGGGLAVQPPIPSFLGEILQMALGTGNVATGLLVQLGELVH